MSVITSIDELEALYTPAPVAASTVKVAHRMTPHYRRLIEASPFAALATIGPEGVDCSPRGDQPGFVRVHDDRTLMMPDRRGNNRIDSLRNIVEDPRVALLFLVPGIGETLRVNGTARISVEPALLARFAVNGQLPRTVLEITVASVYFQCSRAVIRAGLWDVTRQIERSALPTAGGVFKRICPSKVDGDAYDKALSGRIASTLY